MIFTIKKYLLRLALRFSQLLLFLLVVWLVGFCLFLTELQAVKPAPDALRSDAVVVFTGGTARVEEGVRLLKNGAARLLLISGVGQGVTITDILHRVEADGMAITPELAESISLGRTAENTKGNAEETSAWARSNQVRSIRLVTSYYHMPRSRLEFHFMMPECSLIPHPVYSERADLFSRGGVRLALVEYHKFIAVLLRQAGLWPHY